MTSTHSQATDDLIGAYSTIQRTAGDPNDKYLDYPPSIPFIGNSYFKTNPRIMLYASAENLTYTLEHPNCGINSLTLQEQSNRHFNYYVKRHQNRNKYPDIHMRPIKVGGLLLAARFLAECKYPGTFPEGIFEFMDRICCGNIGKFSLATRKNSDYAGDFNHLADSVPYIINDIEVLKPELVILPLTSLRALNRSDSAIAKQLTSLLQGIDHIGIYQVNQRVINGAISSWIKKKPQQHLAAQYSWVSDWSERIDPKMDMHKYLVWLESQLS